MKAVAKVEKLTALMYEKGLSTLSLSKLAGVSDNTIHRMIQFKHYPHPDSTRKLCSALGVEFQEIFELVPEKWKRPFSG